MTRASDKPMVKSQKLRGDDGPGYITKNRVTWCYRFKLGVGVTVRSFWIEKRARESSAEHKGVSKMCLSRVFKVVFKFTLRLLNTDLNWALLWYHLFKPQFKCVFKTRQHVVRIQKGLRSALDYSDAIWLTIYGCQNSNTQRLKHLNTNFSCLSV